MSTQRPATIKAPTGTTLSCKSWLTEAPLRMLMNNLDPQVAEAPENLIVYGGNGKAARNWEAFDAILDELTGADSTEARQELFGQAVALLAENHVGIPLVHDRARYAARTDVLGFDVDPFESILLTNQISLG